MNRISEEILRALIAAQVAVLEHNEEAIGSPNKAKEALLECLKQATKMAKGLE